MTRVWFYGGGPWDAEAHDVELVGSPIVVPMPRRCEVPCNAPDWRKCTVDHVFRRAFYDLDYDQRSARYRAGGKHLAEGWDE